MEIIGHISSCYKEKFGIPKQSSLAPSSTGTIQFKPQFSSPEAFRDLKGMTHIWIIFKFHKASTWKETVRPPALGGNKKIGVFGSRSPFRPNNLGLSLVTLEGVRFSNKCALLDFSNHDRLDRTPVLDIKPYHPMDRSLEANFGWIESLSSQLKREVKFEKSCFKNITLETSHLKLIEELIALNPRPQFHESGKEYGVKILHYNVRWIEESNGPRVLSIEELERST